MEDTTDLKGVLLPGTLRDVLLAAADQKRRGFFEVTSGDASGRVWISDGNLVSAKIDNLQDLGALRRMLTYRHGEFAFHDRPRCPQSRLDRTVAEAILDCAADTDEGEDPRQQVLQSVSMRQRFFSDPANEAPPLDLAGTQAAEAEAEPHQPPEPPSGPSRLKMREGAKKEKKVRKEKRNRETAPTTKPAAEAPQARKPTNWRTILLLAVIVAEAAVILVALRPIGRSRMQAEKEELRREREVEQRQRDEAARKTREAIDALVGRADAAIRDGDLDHALALYGEALALSPEDARLIGLVSTAERVRKERELGQQAIERQRLDSILRGRIESLIEEGDAAKGAGDLGGALTKYESALALSPDDRALAGLVDASRTAIKEKEKNAELARLARHRQDAARQRIDSILNVGDRWRAKGDLATARVNYEAAARLAPLDPRPAERMALLAAHERQRASQGNTVRQWTREVTFTTSTIYSLTLDEGRVIDILVTAYAGPIRIGEMNDFGVASTLYFENTKRRTQGSGTFRIDGTPYVITWELLDVGSRQRTYLITVGMRKKPAVVLPPAE